MPLRAKTWVEVSRRAIAGNMRSIADRVGDRVSLMAVVKSNAYGHGLEIMAKQAVAAGASWLGVDSLPEAIRARQSVAGTPLLILGYTPVDMAAEAAKRGFRLTVYDPRVLRAAARAGKTVRIHVKLETGTTRQGVGERELLALLRAARALPRVVVEGLSTHYANIEDTTDHRYAARQLREFVRLATIAERAYGRPIPVKHTACSAAALLFPDTYFTLARIGIALYGLWPSRETQLSARERGVRVSLTPALTWKTIVAQVKDVPKGTPVSYGLTTRVTRRTKVAVIPVGYWDGFDRRNSSVGTVLVRGRRVPVLGRVCMNMTMIDVTDVPNVRAEDEVVLIGGQRKERVTAEEYAARMGSINYEAVTRINPTLPRVLVP